MRAFTGSRDVPRDMEKAYGFLQAATLNSTEQEHLNVKYFTTLVTKFKLQQERLSQSYSTDRAPDESEKLQMDYNEAMMKLNQELYDLA